MDSGSEQPLPSIIGMESLSMFCLCSERSFDDIVALQRANPLPFDRMIHEYTSCNAGCGSCIEHLMDRCRNDGHLIDELL